MKIIDLSKHIEAGMRVYPGDPEVDIQVVHTYDTHTWELRELKLGSHTGTHVDAFSHMHKSGKSLDDIPLTNFFGRAQVIDPDQDFSKGIGLFFVDEVGIEIFDRIIDSMPPFVGGLISEELERALLSSDIVTYTNLINLDLIPKGLTFMFYGFPLKIRQGDGSPVRAIAIIE